MFLGENNLEFILFYKKKDSPAYSKPGLIYYRDSVCEECFIN